MNKSSRNFIYNCFSSFYRDPSTVIPPPVSLSQRELGFLLLKERIMRRHKVFVRIKDLKLFLGKNVPSDVYRSCAYYETPDAEMDKKGWLGADLVFDIDADHIPTSCSKIHDEWTCANSACEFSGKGITPETCPSCGGQKFEIKTWPCELCLECAKNETVKLIDMLEQDFGFSGKEMCVFFSGHRGYHVHVEGEAVKTLDTMARKEIVDYITGLGLIVSNLDKKVKKGKESKFFLGDFGWNKRIKQGMGSFIMAATNTDLQNIGLSRNTSDLIIDNKERILSQCITAGYWDSIKGIGVKTWKKIAEYVKDLESSKIDTVVTTDTHRLIRMNGTLHGKTGLKKTEFPLGSIDDFDPFEGAVAFKEGAVKVFVSDAPEFRLEGKVFGPYKRKTVELPTAAAVLLVCKGRAEVEN